MQDHLDRDPDRSHRPATAASATPAAPRFASRAASTIAISSPTVVSGWSSVVVDEDARLLLDDAEQLDALE